MARPFLPAVSLLVCLAFGEARAEEKQPVAPLSKWLPLPENGKAVVADDRATMTGEKWTFLHPAGEFSHVELATTVTIEEPAKTLRFFGDGWSAWPDPTFGDGGFEAGMMLRGGKDSGYRMQISHKYQAVALVKYPDGGYLQVVPCEVKLKSPIRLKAEIVGTDISVSVDGKEKIRRTDDFLPLKQGHLGIGVSNGAKVTFGDVAVKAVENTRPLREPPPHVPNFSARSFLGGRKWVFDGDEPILQLHDEKDPSCFAKLKSGYKPQLTFDSHWGIENQGAFPEGAAKWTAPTTAGGGKTLTASWTARNIKDRYTTRSTMTVGYDPKRGTYTYDIDSQLDVLPGEPFHFRYGFDFEHHTPLDPFRWQYLVAKKRDGELYHRPVYPIDPGPQNDLSMTSGARVWYGRHLEELRIAPAVEYSCSLGDTGERKCNTAVCAAFYDTGVSFAPETAKAGTKIGVKYRYTGYPADEAAGLFKQSAIYDSPTLDPNHHYIFADEWPKLTFRKHEPLSKSWIYGRTPFMTAHNTRPTYELVKNAGAGSGFAMKLGPASFAKANWPMPSPLAKGKHVLTALVKSVNVHGPGGRIELEATQAKTNKKLAEARHYVGNGSSEWKTHRFVFETPEQAANLSIAFGNAGTGEMLVTEVELHPWKEGDPPAVIPNSLPADYAKAPVDAVVDYRMLEGKGHHVFNFAGGLPHLELANLDWVLDSGRPSLRFADNTTGRKDFRIDSGLYRNYLNHPGYADKNTLPVALAGHHGGGGPIKGLTLAAWIKPAADMGKSQHGGKGDVLGYGARRFILGLQGQKAPYQLTTRINVNDAVTSATKIDADRWCHIAMTAEPKDGQWSIRLYQDGKPVGEGLTKKFPADSPIVPSLVLGAEIFYFHDAYYRGLIGRSMVFHRALSADEITELSK